MTDPDVFSADIGKYFGPTTETLVALMRDVIICTTGDADAADDEQPTSSVSHTTACRSLNARRPQPRRSIPRARLSPGD